MSLYIIYITSDNSIGSSKQVKSLSMHPHNTHKLTKTMDREFHTLSTRRQIASNVLYESKNYAKVA